MPAKSDDPIQKSISQTPGEAGTNSDQPYFDHHATTPVDPRVLDAMLPYFTEKFGNSSSINHRYGWDAKDAVTTAREQIATGLNVPAKSVIFTSGATEANNLAIKGLLQPLLRQGGAVHVITNAAEHRSVLDPIKRLSRAGATVSVLPVSSCGQVSADVIESSLTSETKLVSIMWANNEIGSINDIAEITELCHDRHIVLHVDAVQALGKIPIDLNTIPVDLVSITAHKLYGPKGVGALIVGHKKSQNRLEPLLDGGGHENHLRSGTLPVPLIVGFGAACKVALQEMETESIRLREMRDKLWNALSNSLDGLILNGHPEQRLAANLNFSVPDLDGEVLMNSMTQIAVSSGSACTSANPEPSHVLRAIGRNDQETRASLRFGLGRFNTDQEIDLAIEFVSATITRLRKAGARPSISSSGD
jgi:cysteine desulfurase